MFFFMRVNAPRAMDLSQSVQAGPTFRIKPFKGPVILSRGSQTRLS